MNRNKLELPKFLIEYQQAKNLHYHQEGILISFILLGLIIILNVLNKIKVF